MPQNRNKLIDLFIGNISNAILHEILIESIKDKSKEIASYYQKEIENVLSISQKYREKINPANTPLSDKDVSYIKTKIIHRVKIELMNRISKGYKNIDLTLVDKLVDKMLKDMGVV
ncbi:hypothetical protein HYS72_00235 [Candidatus Pacearchaeota archaeon]|nr:hypothetical protein [Candidatus Pacearchaeota archaeon]